MSAVEVVIMKIYMYVTKDEFELPLAVAESPDELARMVGTTKNVVLSAISHKHLGWERIEVKEADDED